MIGFSKEDGTVIGIEFMPTRIKPCLVIQKGNELTKVASFNDCYSATLFMDELTDMLGVPRVDWVNNEDIPVGFRLARGWEWEDKDE